MSYWEKLRAYLWGTNAQPSISSSTLPGTGANPDTRTPTEQQADIHFGELVANAAVVVWPTKAASAWRKFAAFNQSVSNACVAFSMAKILGVMRYLNGGVFVALSGGDIYRRRSNAGYSGAANEGMNGQDPYAIAARGVTLDVLLPTQNMSDAQIDALAPADYAGEVGEVFAIQNPSPIVLPTGDIDAVASVIQATGKAVMVWFFFTSREWGAAAAGADFNAPVMLDTLASPTAPGALRHSVAAVDFTMYNGKKALVIEDSAWFGNLNRRVVTEDWYKSRNFYAAYPMNFKETKVANALPKHVFTKSLSFIPWDDVKNAPADMVLNTAQAADVIALQTALQAMTDAGGNTYFPTNVVPSGYYGSLTAKAVYGWGCDHLLPVVPQSTLDSLGGKTFGQASVKEMNAELV